MFSSLSESGFIPTDFKASPRGVRTFGVLISFREWLHSYPNSDILGKLLDLLVLISFREWLHSYEFLWCLDEPQLVLFSSLSESGFIPTRNKNWAPGS